MIRQNISLFGPILIRFGRKKRRLQAERTSGSACLATFLVFRVSFARHATAYSCRLGAVCTSSSYAKTFPCGAWVLGWTTFVNRNINTTFVCPPPPPPWGSIPPLLCKNNPLHEHQ